MVKPDKIEPPRQELKSLALKEIFLAHCSPLLSPPSLKCLPMKSVELELKTLTSLLCCFACKRSSSMGQMVSVIERRAVCLDDMKSCRNSFAL